MIHILYLSLALSLPLSLGYILRGQIDEPECSLRNSNQEMIGLICSLAPLSLENEFYRELFFFLGKKKNNLHNVEVNVCGMNVYIPPCVYLSLYVRWTEDFSTYRKISQDYV